MGSHVNYYWIIHHLILLKDELHRITKEKYQDVIRELKDYEVYPHSDNEHLPDHKDLARKLKYNQSKMNSVLKDLLCELVQEFHYPPLIIKNYVHQVHIHLPYDEEYQLPKDRKEQFWNDQTWIEMILPVTPSIGDEIEIPFIEQTGKLYRGYVHRVSHKLNGSTQEIYIEVHPFNDFYYKWEKMKDRYEYTKRWLANIREQL